MSALFLVNNAMGTQYCPIYIMMLISGAIAAIDWGRTISYKTQKQGVLFRSHIGSSVRMMDVPLHMYVSHKKFLHPE